MICARFDLRGLPLRGSPEVAESSINVWYPPMALISLGPYTFLFASGLAPRNTFTMIPVYRRSELDSSLTGAEVFSAPHRKPQEEYSLVTFHTSPCSCSAHRVNPANPSRVLLSFSILPRLYTNKSTGDNGCHGDGPELTNRYRSMRSQIVKRSTTNYRPNLTLRKWTMCMYV